MSKTAAHLLAIAFAALSLCTEAAQAQGRHGSRVVVAPTFHGHIGPGYGHWRAGRTWGGVSIGFGAPFYTYPYYSPYYGSPWYGGTVLVAPPPVYAEPAPMPVPATKAPPDPIIYPRNNQSPAQTEADRQDCNRWATTQQSAMSDASVFHRATMACMEGRGYTVR